MAVESIDESQGKYPAKKPADVVNKQKDKDDDFIDDVLKIRRQKKAEEIALGAFGDVEPKQDLATSVVTKSMDLTEKSQVRLQDETEKLRQEVLQLQKQGLEMQNMIWNERFGVIKEKEARLEQMANEAKAAGAPQQMFASYNAVREEIAKLVPEQPKTDRLPGTLSEEALLRLEQMKQDHEMRMEELRDSRQAAKQEWELKLLQFQEDRDRRWSEYKDGLSIKQQGLDGLTDLAQSVTAGIRRERGVDEGDGDGGDSIQATIAEFPCSTCKKMVGIPPGASQAKCSNCGTAYDIGSR